MRWFGAQSDLGARYRLLYHRWSPRGRSWPRGHILKYLASKVKFLALASRPQILWIAWKKILEGVFYWRMPEKNFWRRFFWDRLKNFLKTFFSGEHLRLCPWSVASSIPVLGLERVCPRKGCPWPWIFFVFLVLASSLVSSTSASYPLEKFLSEALARGTVTTVMPGASLPPPNDCLCPLSQFWFIRNAFVVHHVTTKQQALMEKGIIIFKHDSRLKFPRLFAKMLATNCCT